MKQHSIFKNSVLNKYTRTNSLFVIKIYVLISIGVYTYGVIFFHSAIIKELLFLFIGLLLFTFIEYVMHRFLYHSGNDYMDEKNWQYKIHGIHHAYPREKDLLAMPLPLALVLSSIFFFLFYILIGNHAYFFFPGFLLGYAAYLFIHYIVHSRQPPHNIFKHLWIHHHKHHHLYDNKAFGVSSPLWDIIFGTMPPKNDVPMSKNKNKRR